MGKTRLVVWWFDVMNKIIEDCCQTNSFKKLTRHGINFLALSRSSLPRTNLMKELTRNFAWNQFPKTLALPFRYTGIL